MVLIQPRDQLGIIKSTGIGAGIQPTSSFLLLSNGTDRLLQSDGVSLIRIEG